MERADEKPLNKKNWVILFSVFGVAIVGLVIAIVVILIARNNKPEEEIDPHQNEMEIEIKEKSEAEEEYEKTMNFINIELGDTNAEDIDEISRVYGYYIDHMSNQEARAMMEVDYYQMLMIYDTNKEKKQEILSSLIRIDGEVQTLNSAATVINAAGYYDDNAIYNKYNQILLERAEMEGLDPSVEADG